MTFIRNAAFFGMVFFCVAMLLHENMFGTEGESQTWVIFWTWGLVSTAVCVLAQACIVCRWIIRQITQKIYARRAIRRVLEADHPFRPDPMQEWRRVK